MPNIDRHLHEHDSLMLGFMQLAPSNEGLLPSNRLIRMCRQMGVHFHNRTDFQHAKKVVSYSPGLEDFAIGLMNSVFNLPDGQVMFFEE